MPVTTVVYDVGMGNAVWIRTVAMLPVPAIVVV